MKTCPYCKNNIEDHWYYCRTCNKPLVANLEVASNRSFGNHSERVEYNHAVWEEDGEIYDNIVIKDEEIDRNLKKIEDILENKEILGETIPGSLLLEKSSLYYKKRDLINAEKNLELALKNFQEVNDDLNISICYNELGLIQEENGFFDQAIYNFNRSLEILKELKQTPRIVKILNNLGNVYFLLKDLEHAYENYQEALQLSESENLKYEEIKSASNLVEVLYLLKDYDRIEKILFRNTEFFNQNEDLYGTIQTQIKYGKLYFIKGEDYDLAYQYFESAFELIKKTDDTTSIYIQARLKWEAYYYLGMLYIIWDNLIEAENSLMQSLEAVRIFGIRENINEGKILEEIGRIYKLKGDNHRAVEYYKLSYEIYYKFGDNVKSAGLKFKLGELYSDFEDSESKTIMYFEEALNLYESMGHTKEAAILLRKLGDLYLHKGMINMSIPNFEKARDYFKDLKDDYSVNLLEEKIKSLSDKY